MYMLPSCVQTLDREHGKLVTRYKGEEMKNVGPVATGLDTVWTQHGRSVDRQGMEERSNSGQGKEGGGTDKER